MKRTVLISGAGIAGPALAFWLSRGGHDVTVVERAPAPRPGGQAVDLRGAGRTVVDRMGLLGRAREVTLDQRGILNVGANGRVMSRMPVEAFGGEGIVSEIEILRGDLARVFLDASLPATTYVFDDTVTALEQDAGGVGVTFEKAAPRRFDLVVGADGLHSAVRGLAVAAEPACVQPLGCWTAWFTTPADPGLDGWYHMYNAPGGFVASLRPGRIGTEAKASLSFRSSPADPADLGRGGVEAQKALVAQRFRGIGWKVPWLLDAMRDAGDFSFDAVAQVHLDRWSNGRVVLLGDAGYCPTPLTGLGTSLALVGAYVLAGELALAGGDHRVAFRRYEEILRPYVKEAQQLPPGGVGGYAPRSATSIRLRALSMRMMTRWPMRPLIAAQFAKADEIDLPDYDLEPAA
jgi:2-polyprenyl-6-methoxyphenol hydroxylase-like FAD-dependent oxidoreductase